MKLEYLKNHVWRNREAYSGILLCLMLMTSSTRQAEIAIQDRDRLIAGIPTLETPQRGSERINLGLTGVFVSLGGLAWGNYIIHSNALHRRRSSR